MKKSLNNVCGFPSGIFGLCILPLYQYLLDSVLVETMLTFNNVSFDLQPNGTFFVQFLKASLNTTIRSDHFL